MPPIEELRKKVDEDWAAGKIGPPNTRRTARGGSGGGVHAARESRRDGGVSPQTPTRLTGSISTQARRARDESKGESRDESKEGASDAPWDRASERADVFFFCSDRRAEYARRATCWRAFSWDEAPPWSSWPPIQRGAFSGPCSKSSDSREAQKSARVEVRRPCIRKSTTKLIPTRLVTALNDHPRTNLAAPHPRAINTRVAFMRCVSYR